MNCFIGREGLREGSLVSIHCKRGVRGGHLESIHCKRGVQRGKSWI